MLTLASADLEIEQLTAELGGSGASDALVARMDQLRTDCVRQRDGASCEVQSDAGTGAAIGGVIGLFFGVAGAAIGAAIGGAIGAQGATSPRAEWERRLARIEALLAQARRRSAAAGPPAPPSPQPSPVSVAPRPAAQPIGPPAGPFVTPLAGVTYGGRQAHLAAAIVGGEVRLLRRPANPFDANAIEALAQEGASLGWLPRETARLYAPAMDAGRPLYGRIQAIIGRGSAGGNLGVRVELRWEPPPAMPAEPARPGRVATGGIRVQHPAFGAGVVLQVHGLGSDATATVRFGDSGNRKLQILCAGLTTIPDGDDVTPPPSPPAPPQTIHGVDLDEWEDDGCGESLDVWDDDPQDWDPCDDYPPEERESFEDLCAEGLGPGEITIEDADNVR